MVSSVKHFGSFALTRTSSLKLNKRLPSNTLPKVRSLSNMNNIAQLEFDQQKRPIIRVEDLRR